VSEVKKPAKEVFFPREKCHPASFRTDLLTKEDHVVRYIWCCEREKYNEERGVCENTIKLHAMYREPLGGSSMSEPESVEKELKKALPAVLDLEHEFSPEPEVSAKCATVLGAPVPCEDFRGIRRYVLCAAWRRMEEEKKPFKEAVREAWAEARKACAGKV
jgi:hypothetical protein